MNAFLRDLRYATRLLLTERNSSLVAIGTLSLGMAAATIIFSVINATLLKPLGTVDSDRLVLLYSTDARGTKVYPSQADYFDLRARTTVFEDMVAWRGKDFTYTGDGHQPLQVYAHRVSNGFFPFLGIHALVGRTFSPDEYLPGRGLVTVLSHELWTELFDRDNGVIGRAIAIDGRLYTVVGVLPESNFQLSAVNRPELWIPLQLTEDEQLSRRSQVLGCLARLRSDVTLQEAQAEVELVAQQLAGQYPESNEGYGAIVVYAADDLVGDVRPTFFLLVGAAVLLLAIAYANVGSLLLARSAVRRREFAIRYAIGIPRYRLLRQLVTEGLLLSTLGAILGVLLAIALLPPLLYLVPNNLPHIGMQNIRVDSSVLIFVVCLSFLIGLVFGVVPAYRAGTHSTMEALRDGSRGSTGSVRGRRLLESVVIAEFALAFLLLSGCGLLATSVLGLLEIDPGFDPAGVTTMQVVLAETKYPPDEPHKAKRFFDDLLRRIARVAGVESVGAISDLPLRSFSRDSAFSIVGTSTRTGADKPRAGVHFVTPGYFRTMRVPLLEGRLFDERDDRRAAPVALISETMAKRFWPSSNPIGSIIEVEFLQSDRVAESSRLQVVGVVGDVRKRGLGSPVEPEIYYPHAQVPHRFAVLVIRTAGVVGSVATAASKQVWMIDPDQPIYEIRTLEQIVLDSVWHLRFAMTVVSAFALLALLLGGAGVYAVVSYAIAQRQDEVRIRMMLGASPTRIVRLLVGHGPKLALAGIAFGISAALPVFRVVDTWVSETIELGGAGRLLAAAHQYMIFGSPGAEIYVYAGVTVVLMAMSVAACAIPAFRAARDRSVKGS